MKLPTLAILPILAPAHSLLPTPCAGPGSPDWSLASPPSPLDQVSLNEFGRELLRLLTEEHDIQGLVFDEAERRIAGQRPFEIALSNLYSTYLATPVEERADYLESIADTLAKVSYQDELALSKVVQNLVPKVWLRSTFDSLAIERQGLGATAETFMVTVPEWRLGDHLAAFLAIDSPTTTTAVTQDMLASWDIPANVLCSLALGNLQARAFEWDRDLSMEFAGSGNLFPDETSDTDYLASRLLLLQDEPTFQLREGTLAGLPSRSHLTLHMPGDPAREELFFEWFDAASEAPYPLLPRPLVLENGTWVDWQPPTSHPRASDLAERHKLFLNELYGNQREAIERLQEAYLNEDAGEDSTILDISEDRIPTEYAATQHLFRSKEDSKLTSVTFWTDGTMVLLPKSDLVLLGRDSEDQDLEVTWTSLLECAPKSLEQVDATHPPLYRSRAFPTDLQLDALRAANAHR